LLTKLREGDRKLVVDVKQRVHVRAGLKADLSHVVASINRLSTDVRHSSCFRTGSITRVTSLRDVSELARALDVTIYTITLHDGQLLRVIARNRDVGRAMWEMRALAFDTGGRAFFPSKVAELQAVYS
jgi:hypothetical protein